jgi:hypothetical protein
MKNIRVPGINSAIPYLRKNPDYDLEVKDGQIKWIRWKDDDNLGPPTWEEILEQIAKDEKVYAYYKYIRDREADYGDWKDQLNLLYDDIESGNLENGKWVQMIKSVKAKYPKPEEPFLPLE